MQETRRSVLDPANDIPGPEREVVSGSIAWAEMVLRDQEMPPDELRAALTTADPELLRRLFELHLERLKEWLITQRRSVAAAERILTEAAGAASSARPAFVELGTPRDGQPAPSDGRGRRSARRRSRPG